MIVPNLFIVGAAKAGTTTLWSALKMHPEIFMSESMDLKEPCYFVDGYGVNSLDEYLSSFPKSGYRFVGDASAAYLSSAEASEKIFAFNPDSKVIILLRNPADRAYSLYNWMVQEGYEWISTFERALAYEPTRMKRKIPNPWEPAFRDDYLYFASGLYYEQVRRYLDLFGDNVKIFLFDDLVSSSAKILEECQIFLGVDKVELKANRENPSCHVLSPKLAYAMKFLDRYCSKITRRKWPNGKMVKLVQSNKRPPKMAQVTRRRLLEEYEDDIRKLEQLIQRDLSAWMNY